MTILSSYGFSFLSHFSSSLPRLVLLSRLVNFLPFVILIFSCWVLCISKMFLVCIIAACFVLCIVVCIFRPVMLPLYLLRAYFVRMPYGLPIRMIFFKLVFSFIEILIRIVNPYGFFLNVFLLLK